MKDRFVTAAIIKIGAQGDGLATHHGLPVYVAKTAPGDMVNFALGKPRAEGYAGTLQKIIKPSKHRVEPPCPYFAKCGGCSLQHVTQQFYREWKVTKVKNALFRADVEAKIINEPVFLPAPTRRRTTLTAIKGSAGLTFGYNEARSHNIINVERCPILHPELDKKVQALRPYLPSILAGKPADVTVQYIDGAFDLIFTGLLQTRGKFTYEQDEAFGEIAEKLDIARISWRQKDFHPPQVILNRKSVMKKFGSLKVELPPAAFLQASAEGEDALVKLVMSHAKDASKALDLFSGCGTFTGHLLDAGAAVTAIDGDAGAINALAATKHPKLNAKKRDLFKLPLSETELDGFDLAVFDPPRAGAKEQCEKLAYSEIRRIIGVSCNPGTFARDAAILQTGGYKLESLTLVDQFVWSAHIELVGLFVKN